MDLERRVFSGSTLYHQRVNLGLTQDDLAKKIGRTKAAVSYWEIGKTCPSPHSLLLLAKTLKIKPYMFFKRAKKPSTD